MSVWTSTYPDRLTLKCRSIAPTTGPRALEPAAPRRLYHQPHARRPKMKDKAQEQRNQGIGCLVIPRHHRRELASVLRRRITAGSSAQLATVLDCSLRSDGDRRRLAINPNDVVGIGCRNHRLERQPALGVVDKGSRSCRLRLVRPYEPLVDPPRPSPIGSLKSRSEARLGVRPSSQADPYSLNHELRHTGSPPCHRCRMAGVSSLLVETAAERNSWGELSFGAMLLLFCTVDHACVDAAPSRSHQR